MGAVGVSHRGRHARVAVVAGRARGLTGRSRSGVGVAVRVGIDGVVRRAVDRDRRRRRVDDGDCLRVADGVVAAIVGRPHVEDGAGRSASGRTGALGFKDGQCTLAIVHGSQRGLRGNVLATLNGQVAGQIGRPVGLFGVGQGDGLDTHGHVAAVVGGRPRPRDGLAAVRGRDLIRVAHPGIAAIVGGRGRAGVGRVGRGAALQIKVGGTGDARRGVVVHRDDLVANEDEGFRVGTGQHVHLGHEGPLDDRGTAAGLLVHVRPVDVGVDQGAGVRVNIIGLHVVRHVHAAAGVVVHNVIGRNIGAEGLEHRSPRLRRTEGSGAVHGDIVGTIQFKSAAPATTGKAHGAGVGFSVHEGVVERIQGVHQIGQGNRGGTSTQVIIGQGDHLGEGEVGEVAPFKFEVFHAHIRGAERRIGDVEAHGQLGREQLAGQHAATRSRIRRRGGQHHSSRPLRQEGLHGAA